MKERPAVRKVLTDPVHFFAFGFGSGLVPRAPGTAGTLVGLALEAALRLFEVAWATRVALVLILVAAGVWICGESARRLDEHDHPGIVWDEIAGIMVTMLAAPPGWQGLALGFVLFRVFDIAKPWPIRWADRRVSGGLGIMLDDVLAAILAMAVMMLLQGSGVLS